MLSSPTLWPHLEAVKSLIQPLGYQVYVIDVPETPELPYVLLWSSIGVPAEEYALDGARVDVDDTIGVTVTAGTPEGVFIVQKHVRSVLADATPTLSEGNAGELRVVASQPVVMDRDTFIPGTARNPAYAVDLYRAVTAN